MKPLEFSLTPFQDRPLAPDATIAGSIARVADALRVDCEVRGDLSRLAIPACAGAPRRMDRLWETTCLELFIAASGSEEYREFNLSPSGDWNVYGFASYRDGMREEPAFDSLPFDVRSEPGVLRFSVAVDIGRIVPAGTAVDAAVCAVIRTKAGGASHWALSHPAARPDFHRRDGFGLRL